eukprot:TRINITY_DN34335_c0_g1_i1.p1 TRINITY_DN34335_c0_g1~~TRINITY_DN34335_c0_g1_i1.p1  ORF type:complete len:267 (-),score=42.43 TRINITY_DN34335_c0_g1_i1:235-1035(-)
MQGPTTTGMGCGIGASAVPISEERGSTGSSHVTKLHTAVEDTKGLEETLVEHVSLRADKTGEKQHHEAFGKPMSFRGFLEKVQREAEEGRGITVTVSSSSSTRQPLRVTPKSSRRVGPKGGPIQVYWRCAEEGQDSQHSQSPLLLWVPHVSREGLLYFYNESTQESVWELKEHDAIVPTYWSEHWQDGKVFYCNRSNGETSWRLVPGGVVVGVVVDAAKMTALSDSKQQPLHEDLMQAQAAGSNAFLSFSRTREIPTQDSVEVLDL